jgi:hypothetical protein
MPKPNQNPSRISIDPAFVKSLIHQAIRNNVPTGNLINDGIHPDSPADDLADIVVKYAQLSPAHAERLVVPNACFSLGVTLSVGATLYSLLALSDVSLDARRHPVRLLHVGANLLECMMGDYSCAAYRSLFPRTRSIEHTFIGPDAGDVLHVGSSIPHPEFFPNIAPSLRREHIHVGTLSQVFEQNPRLREEVLSGAFDALVFANPGFVAGNGTSWIDCPAVSEVMEGHPNLRIVGTSQNPVDFSLDKVFLESRSRAVANAYLNTSTCIGDYSLGGRWAGVLWVTKPFEAGAPGAMPEGCLPKSSLDLTAAIDLLQESSDHEVWMSSDCFSMSPGEFVPGQFNCLRVTPSIIFEIDTATFVIGEGDDAIGLSVEDEVSPAELALLRNGDYWQRLDFVCDHIGHLCSVEAQVRQTNELDFLMGLMQR